MPRRISGIVGYKVPAPSVFKTTEPIDQTLGISAKESQCYCGSFTQTGEKSAVVLVYGLLKKTAPIAVIDRDVAAEEKASAVAS